MGLIERMLNKAVLPFALAAVLGGASSFWIINATCSGECCSAGATTCTSGPCPKEPAAEE
jgi:hypothetical protein